MAHKADCSDCDFDATEPTVAVADLAAERHLDDYPDHNVDIDEVDSDEADALTDGGAIASDTLQYLKNQSSTTDDEEKKVCPECGSVQVVKRYPEHPYGKTAGGDWYCRGDCNGHVDPVPYSDYYGDDDDEVDRGDGVATDGGVGELVITSGFVADRAVPADDAVTYVHLGLDDAFHPAGGYWFPSDFEPDGEISGWVHREGEIPHGDLIQYPCDDREPRIVGFDSLPDWVENRVVVDTDPISDDVRTDGGRRVEEGQVFGECPNGHGDESGFIAADTSADWPASYPTCPICGHKLDNTISTDGGQRADPNRIHGAHNWASKEQLATFSRELDTVFSRHNELVVSRPDLAVALLINMADGLRDKFNLDFEVDELGGTHYAIFVGDGDAAGLFGFVRDDEGGVDVSHIPDAVDVGRGRHVDE